MRDRIGVQHESDGCLMMRRRTPVIAMADTTGEIGTQTATAAMAMVSVRIDSKIAAGTATPSDASQTAARLGKAAGASASENAGIANGSAVVTTIPRSRSGWMSRSRTRMTRSVA